LTITNFASTSELIQNSAVTIGFDSTVLIEAAIMRRPIVCPDFRHFLSDRSWDFLAGFEGLVRYVKTDQELTRALLGADSPTPEYNKARDAFLTELIGGVEGGASLKAEQAIIETI
jgi:hypothetical protein